LQLHIFIGARTIGNKVTEYLAMTTSYGFNKISLQPLVCVDGCSNIQLLLDHRNAFPILLFLTPHHLLQRTLWMLILILEVVSAALRLGKLLSEPLVSSISLFTRSSWARRQANPGLILRKSGSPTSGEWRPVFVFVSNFLSVLR